MEISKRTSVPAIAMIKKTGIIFVAAGAHAIRIPPTQITILEKQIVRRRFTWLKITPPVKAVTAQAMLIVITFSNTSPGKYFAFSLTNYKLKCAQAKKYDIKTRFFRI